MGGKWPSVRVPAGFKRPDGIRKVFRRKEAEPPAPAMGSPQPPPSPETTLLIILPIRAPYQPQDTFRSAPTSVPHPQPSFPGWWHEEATARSLGGRGMTRDAYAGGRSPPSGTAPGSRLQTVWACPRAHSLCRQQSPSRSPPTPFSDPEGRGRPGGRLEHTPQLLHPNPRPRASSPASQGLGVFTHTAGWPHLPCRSGVRLGNTACSCPARAGHPGRPQRLAVPPRPLRALVPALPPRGLHPRVAALTPAIKSQFPDLVCSPGPQARGLGFLSPLPPLCLFSPLP